MKLQFVLEPPALRYFNFTNYFTLKVTFQVGISMNTVLHIFFLILSRFFHLMILPVEVSFHIVCYYKNVTMETLRFGVPSTKAPLPLASSQFHFSSISSDIKKVRNKLR